jgi:glycerol-3-phosphate dehydrogenase
VDVGLSNVEAEQLVRRYGSNIERVFNLLTSNLDDTQKYHLPIYLFAQLVYALEEEMIATPIDFLNRRTGDMLFNIQRVRKWQKQIIAYMANRFRWSEQVIKKYTLEVEDALKACVIPVDEDVDDSHLVEND